MDPSSELYLIVLGGLGLCVFALALLGYPLLLLWCALGSDLRRHSGFVYSGILTRRGNHVLESVIDLRVVEPLIQILRS